MTRVLVMAVFGALLFTACGRTTLGIPCDNRDDCEPAQDCFTAPGGFCTRGCTEPGQSRDCPSGTICTFFGETQVCSTPCNVDADCRVNFECVLTHQGGTKSACRPVP
jgi:hypothetical protein